MQVSRTGQGLFPHPTCVEGEPEADSSEEIDNLVGLYPPLVAEMSEPFVIRGVRLVKVTTYPVQPSNSK